MPSARESKAERHGRFIASLGDRLIWRYTDGGPGIERTGRSEPRGRIGTGGRFARSVRRRKDR